ncbi:MAG: LysM peptidoglycan-binding domain-containing protein, partial [Candidatus Promineifilaceae bacterium]|nr:LysM peptidoglycan-binding domain-containing protein [Candidatus Promineifilaceae bacterium]
MLSSPRFRVLLSLRRALVLAALTLTIAACVRPVREESTIREPALGNKSLSTAVSAPATPWPTPTLVPTVDLVPTADPTRPQDRAQIGTHTVRAGETLTAIASFYGSTVVELVELNQLEDSDQLVVNQVLLVPSRQTLPGSAFKIIPNSELVYGPALIDFDTVKTVAQFGGYLSEYSEEVEQRELSGAEVVELIARRFSIGPRLLLAVVEHQSGWV